MSLTNIRSGLGRGVVFGKRRVLFTACRSTQARSFAAAAATASDRIWRPTTALDEWVEREARPVSLRQLTVFGRALTESRLVSSANYVRTELPTRIAHRLRDMQSLPYAVIANPSMSHVYELYYKAFDIFRRVPEIKSIKDNEKFCETINEALVIHQTVIPRLVQGVIECQDLISAEKMDGLVNTLLRARISRRVIAEQHLALTTSFHAPSSSKRDAKSDNGSDIIGEVFLHCNVRQTVENCASVIRSLSEQTFPDATVPEVKVLGHLDATLTYIPSHLEYMVGELLRNSIRAVVQRQRSNSAAPPPIEVLICEAPQHVILRISDQGGGIPKDTIPTLWSFVKSPDPQQRMDSLVKIRQMSATLQEIHAPQSQPHSDAQTSSDDNTPEGTLSSLSGRPANYSLGIGLPMSRVYAEYWAGSLEMHSLEGYGVDAFLQLSKLGNKNERLSMRASMDAL